MYEIHTGEREAFLMALSGKSHSDIAKQFNISTETAAEWLQICFMKLRHFNNIDDDTHQKNYDCRISIARKNKAFWIEQLAIYDAYISIYGEYALMKKIDNVFRDALRNGVSYYKMAHILKKKADLLKVEYEDKMSDERENNAS